MNGACQPIIGVPPGPGTGRHPRAWTLLPLRRPALVAWCDGMAHFPGDIEALRDRIIGPTKAGDVWGFKGLESPKAHERVVPRPGVEGSDYGLVIALEPGKAPQIALPSSKTPSTRSPVTFRRSPKSQLRVRFPGLLEAIAFGEPRIQLGKDEQRLSARTELPLLGRRGSVNGTKRPKEPLDLRQIRARSGEDVGSLSEQVGGFLCPDLARLFARRGVRHLPENSPPQSPEEGQKLCEARLGRLAPKRRVALPKDPVGELGRPVRDGAMDEAALRREGGSL